MNTAASGVDQDLVDMIDRVFADYRKDHLFAAPVERDRKLWQQLDELGLVRLTGSESSGGSGAGWYEAAELLSAAVRHGVRAPLAEHDLLACALLDELGLPVDDAVRTVCVLGDQGATTGVPWADGADRIVILHIADGRYHLADVDAVKVQITPGANPIGEPRNTVAADPLALGGVPIAPEMVSRLWLKSALVRSIQACAALDRALDLSVDHATSRTQFGRPLSKFQAVQHLIADTAAEAGLARAATEAALNAAVSSGWAASNLPFLVAVARSCTGHAASKVARNAHQVHGAIGTTREHRLGEFTRPALVWRSEFGSVRHWDEEVTRMACDAGAAGLWSLVTG